MSETKTENMSFMSLCAELRHSFEKLVVFINSKLNDRHWKLKKYYLKNNLETFVKQIFC